MSERHTAITEMLQTIDRGGSTSHEALFGLVYDELRNRAGQLMRGERKGHTLQATELVHEAYLRVARPGASFESRLHFFNAAALAMRRILIDYADRRGAAKRGGKDAREITLEDFDVADDRKQDDIDILALDEALTALAAKSPRQAQVVSLRFFAGVSEREIADMLGINEKTVRRDWATAKLWLFDAMKH